MQSNEKKEEFLEINGGEDEIDALRLYSFIGEYQILYNYRVNCCSCGTMLSNGYCFIINSLMVKKLIPDNYRYECCFCRAGFYELGAL